MTVAEIKTTLHRQIDTSDETLLKRVYALMNGCEEDTEKTEDARKKLIMAERANYLAGSGRSCSWDEVKNMAIKGIKP